MGLLPLFSCYLTAAAKSVARKLCKGFYFSQQSLAKGAHSSFTYPHSATSMETDSLARWDGELFGLSLHFRLI